MYTRVLARPHSSFFLFGPRGTGKTTWLKSSAPNAHWFDLLRNQELIRLARDPSLFAKEILSLPLNTWIVVDEVQRMPSLLNEVQAVLTESSHRYRFALTGSSARKLKALDTNLLAGRAINRKFFPLTSKELNFDLDVNDLLESGCLPAARTAKSALDKRDFLESYVDNYIREEIKQEALVKNLESFIRFLDVASLMNAQVLNMAGTARDSGVARPTVQGYFQVLIDTLIGSYLPAWKARAKVKEKEHPKFYFFDCGVVRALNHQLRDPMERADRGFLFETLILNELRAYTHYEDIGGEFFYWGTPSGAEIDIIWQRGKQRVGFEIKATENWKSSFSESLKEFLALKKIQKGFGIYLGERQLKDGDVSVLPFKTFCKLLYNGEILNSI